MQRTTLRASPLLERSILALAAGAIAAVLLYAAPPGTDSAEHALQQHLYAAHGPTPWSDLWYSGRYSLLSYSVAYSPLATLVGIRPLAIACVVAGVLSADAITARRWPGQRRWVAFSTVLVGPSIVVTAEFPFLL